MQFDLVNLRNWFEANKLKMNVSKTKYICYNICNRYIIDWDLYYHSMDCLKNECSDCLPLERVSNFKYLGITLDECLKWRQHVENVANSMRQTISNFYFIRNKCPTYFLKLIYNALVNTRLNYGVFSWGAAYKNSIRSIVVLQKRLIRVI